MGFTGVLPVDSAVAGSSRFVQIAHFVRPRKTSENVSEFWQLALHTSHWEIIPLQRDNRIPSNQMNKFTCQPGSRGGADSSKSQQRLL